jgi:hypothetical protein
MRVPIIIALGLVIALGTGVAPVLAQDSSAKLDEHVSAINRAAQTPQGEEVVAARLSKELGIPASTLEAQRAQTKLGWGELLIANRLAQTSGLSFDQVVGEFRSGKGWGKIAKEHNVNLGQLVSDVRRSAHAVEAEGRRGERGRSSGAFESAGDKPSVSERDGPGSHGMGTSGTGMGGPGGRGGGRGR